MADPISIAGLILAIGDLIKSAYKYGKEVKEVSKEMTSLYGELVALQGVLLHIEAQQDEKKIDELDPRTKQLCASPNFQSALLTSDEIIRRLMQILEKRASTNSLSGILTWPLIKGDVKEDISRLERVKSYFLLVMMTDNSSILQETSENIHEISSAIKTQQRLQQEKDDAMKQEILQKRLSPANPEVSHAKASATRQPDTGAWFIQGPLKYALYGYKASGKSTILWLRGKYQLQSKRPKKFLNADRRAGLHTSTALSMTASLREPASILGSILVQLLNRMPNELQGIEQSLPPRGQPSTEVVRGLILKILQKLSRCFLLLDAINECYNPEIVLQQFVDLAQRAQNIAIVITSTSSPTPTSISMVIANVMEVDMGSAPLGDDMITYINAQTNERQSLRGLSQVLQERIKSELLAKANGMFRYVQCQIDYLSTQKTGRDVKEALDKLPEDLFGTYAATLARVKQADREMARDALQWLAHTREPPTLVELGEAIVVREGDHIIDKDCRITDPVILLEICQGLISYSNSTSRVALAHPSVRTFLTSDQLERDRAVFYSMSENIAEEKIARKCLTYLMLDDFQSGYCEKRTLQERLERYPLLRYAAAH